MKHVPTRVHRLIRRKLSRRIAGATSGEARQLETLRRMEPPRRPAPRSEYLWLGTVNVPSAPINLQQQRKQRAMPPTNGQTLLKNMKARVPYQIVQLPDGTFQGMAKVTTRWGTVIVHATASPSVEAQRYIRALLAARQGGAAAGFSLKKLARGIGKTLTAPIKATLDIGKKLAQGKIKAALMAAVKHVSSTPLAKIALPIVTKNPAIRNMIAAATTPFIGPLGPMLLGPALRMAGGLVEQARGGNPQAKASVATIVASARAGNPRAKQMLPNLTKAAGLLAKAPNFFSLAQQQANQLARQAGMSAGGSENGNGQWIVTQGGQVFVPHAYSAVAGSALGDVWNQLRPHAGYRAPGKALTFREAYYQGLRASPRAHSPR